jgi:hypothetical protein
MLRLGAASGVDELKEPTALGQALRIALRSGERDDAGIEEERRNSATSVEGASWSRMTDGVGE